MTGDGNISNNPAFVDSTSGNYRLDTNSLCVNAGANALWMIGVTDLDGSNRVAGGRVDMGAYEADGAWVTTADADSDGLNDWDELAVHGTDPDNAYSDNDTMNDGDEVIAGTDPNESGSVFEVSSFNALGGGTNEITWDSVSNRRYRVERSYDLLNSNGWVELWGPGWQPSPMVFIDLSATNAAAYYRLRVEKPSRRVR